MLLTVIIPCFNEKETIEKLVNKVIKLKKIKKQIIIIDDCSSDGTRKIIKNKLNKKVNKVIYHKKNLGKGAAIKSSIKHIKGDLIIIQDADLEYDPKDYSKLIKPFLNSKINVVYGSRVLNKKRFKKNNTISKNYRIFGNYILTMFSNLINDQYLTDAHTCYKVIRKDLFLKLKLKENDFSFCPEVTTKLSNLNENITEIPIKYIGREYNEGKKIKFKDAFFAIKTIFKYRFINF